MAESVKQNQKTSLKNIISNVLSDDPTDKGEFKQNNEPINNNNNESKIMKNSYYESPKNNRSGYYSPVKETFTKNENNSSPLPRNTKKSMYNSPSRSPDRGEKADKKSFYNNKSSNEQIETKYNNTNNNNNNTNYNNYNNNNNNNTNNNNSSTKLKKGINRYDIYDDNEDNDTSLMEMETKKHKVNRYIPKDFYERELQLQAEKNHRLELCRQKKEREEDEKYDYNPKISNTSRQIINDKFNNVRPIYERTNEILDQKHLNLVAKKRELIEKTESDVYDPIANMKNPLKYDDNRFQNWRDEHMRWHNEVVEKAKRIKVENQIFEEQNMMTQKPTINKTSANLVKDRDKHNIEHKRHNLLYKDHEERQVKKNKLIKDNTPAFKPIINTQLPKYLLNRNKASKMNSDSKLVNTFELNNNELKGVNSNAKNSNKAIAPRSTKSNNLPSSANLSKKNTNVTSKLTSKLNSKLSTKSISKNMNRSMDEIIIEDREGELLEYRGENKDKNNLVTKGSFLYLDDEKPDFNDEYFKKEDVAKPKKIRSASVVQNNFVDDRFREEEAEEQSRQLIEDYKRKVFSKDPNFSKENTFSVGKDKIINNNSTNNGNKNSGRNKSVIYNNSSLIDTALDNQDKKSIAYSNTKNLYKINLRNGTNFDQAIENSFVLSSDMTKVFSKSKLDYDNILNQ